MRRQWRLQYKSYIYRSDNYLVTVEHVKKQILEIHNLYTNELIIKLEIPKSTTIKQALERAEIIIKGKGAKNA